MKKESIYDAPKITGKFGRFVWAQLGLISADKKWFRTVCKNIRPFKQLLYNDSLRILHESNYTDYYGANANNKVTQFDVVVVYVPTK